MSLRVSLLAFFLLAVPASASADWRADLDATYAAGLQESPELYAAVADAQPRQTRAGTLRFFGESAVLDAAAIPAVLRRLADGTDEPAVRRALAERLHRAPATWDDARLQLLADDAAPEVRAMLAAGLRWMDAAAARPAFEVALSDAAPIVRAEAARTVSRRADGAELAPLLVPVLEDAAPSVRLQAVKALGAVAPDLAPTVLAPLVDDVDARVGKAARRAVAR